MKRTAALLVVALLAAVPAFASTFVAMSPKEMVSEADAVVVARVTDRVSSWTESGRLVYTDNSLAVEDVVLGEAPSFVTVRTFGGQIGDVQVEAHGFPKLEDGERVLLFLREDRETGATRILGYQQGHFRVVTRLDGVTLAVPMVDEGARLLDRQGRPVPELRSLPLGELKARILNEAARLGRAIEK